MSNRITCISIILLLSFIAGCSKNNSSPWANRESESPKSETEESSSIDESTESEKQSMSDESNTVAEHPEKKFGGIIISEITEIGYHGKELKSTAEKIAKKLSEMGAGKMRIFEGTPSSDSVSVEIGYVKGDGRLEDVQKNEAYITSDGKHIFAAVPKDVNSNIRAADLLYYYIISEKYSEAFAEKIKLYEVKSVKENNSELPPQIHELSAYELRTKAYFQGTTEKNSLEYEIGEEIVFEISMKKSNKDLGAPKFLYEITGDDGQKISGTVDGTSGQVKISTVMTSPGFIHIKVQPALKNGTVISDKADIYEGGAGASLEMLEQSIEEPDDFDEFWRSQLKKLDDIGCSVISKTEIASTRRGFVTYDIQISCVDGSMPSSGIITMPKRVPKGSLNAKMVFQGYGSPAAVTPIYENNTIVFSVNPHGVLNYGQNTKYYSDFEKSICSTYNGTTHSFGFNSEENLSPESSYFLNMILRDVQAARYILSLKEYNGKGIELSGGSMGGMQAINVASLIGNENVKKLVLSYPWLSNFGADTVGKLGPFWGPSSVDKNENFTKGLLYFDPVNHAKRVKSEVEITSCLGDYICPPYGQVVLYKSFASEKKSLTFLQNSTHGYQSPNPARYLIRW